MQPLFPRWSNSALWAALILGGAAVLGLPIALMIWVRTPYSTDSLDPVQQPIPFDHRHHVLDDGIDCLYCHYQADDSPTAGMPPTELCMGCHAQIWNDSPLLEPLRRSWFTGRPVRWQRVTAMPDFVFFHHAVHVRRGVECAACHGAVEEMPVVFAARPMTMGFCLDCHRHPEKYLPPGAGSPIAERRELQAGIEPVQHVPIDPPTHCTACHR